jgi:glycerol-3-phosphate dehydrogenase (NAD(P)+)
MTLTAAPNARLAVLGAGSWGATLASHLTAAGHTVSLWSHRAEELDALLAAGHPPGVPELRLPPLGAVTSDLAAAVAGADAAVVVVPAQAVAALCARLAAAGAARLPIILASKGIDLATLRPLSTVVEEALPAAPVAVVSGPCIAREVAAGVPTSVVAASTNEALATAAQQWFASPTFRVYRQSDVLGVELGGAIKNVIAIAAGIGDGLGFGANSKSALLTRGLAEMQRFAVALGADARTISGLSGLGDLCVTCFSPHSRNRRFGEALGRGATVAETIAAIGETVEGVPTAHAVVRLAARAGVDVPISAAVVEILEGRWSPAHAVAQLMTRRLREEF